MVDEAYVELLIHTCSIEPVSNVNDNLLNPIPAYGAPAPGIRCRKVALGGTTDEGMVGAVYNADYMFYMMPDQAVKEKDRLVEGGQRYIVVGVEPCPDDEGVHHLEIFCNKHALGL